MRECWVNVYRYGHRVACGSPNRTRELADLAASGVLLPLAYRLHVRLKPSKFERATGLREAPAW